MSKKIDERVVEMRFDNKQFENNVQTTMSTVEKLKKSLRFDNASKGFDNLSHSAKRVDISPIGNAVDSVKVKFSAFEVMAVTALSNITNSAVNAGKRMASSLTIDPIRSGFHEYETQINAVQTILANTQKEGTNIDDVNKALDELNEYSDLTIYNFTEMTRNIGTFTAAGVKLQTSVDAIQGIANLAAVSGSTSQQASTAMYQLSQALASGTVKLMDWNSVVNAGMGGQVFQDALTKTSELLGTGAKAAIEAEGSFRESLSTGWLTAEVLTETLKKFTTSGANEYVAEYTGLSVEAVEASLANAEAQYGEADAIKYAAEELAKKSGKSKEEIQSTLELARTATDAATKVKTLTQLWDVMKEAAQSGWAQSWRTIIGDFEEAKSLFTELSDTFTKIIGKSADSRNKVLSGALDSKWDTFIDKVNEAGVSTETFNAKLEETAGKYVDVKALVKEYGSLESAISKGLIPAEAFTDALNALSTEGTDTAKGLAKANEYIVKSGDTLSEIAAKYGTTWQELYKLNKDIINNPDLIHPEQILKLNDAQLESMGYTKKQIGLLRELAKEAEKTGTPMRELVESMAKPSGRELLIDSLMNSINAVIKVVGAFKQAWKEAFWGDLSDEEIIDRKAKRLYNLIDAIHTFTEKLIISDETAGKITRTFKGVFAIFDILRTFVGGALSVSFRILRTILGAFNLDILDVTAGVGDAIVKFRDWLFENNLLVKGIYKVVDVVKTGALRVKKFVDAFVKIPEVEKSISNVSEAFSNSFSKIKEHFSGFNEAFQTFFDKIDKLDNLTLDDVFGLFKSLKDSIVDWYKSFDFSFDSIFDALSKFRTTLEEQFTKAGSGFGKLKDKLVDFAEFIKSKIPAAIAIAMGIGTIKAIQKFAGVLELLASPLEVMDSLKDVLDQLTSSLKALTKAYKFKLIADSILTLAFAVAVLAGAVALLSFLDQGKLWSAVGAVSVLMIALAALSFAVSKINSFADMGKAAISILSISASLFILVQCLKQMEDLDGWKAVKNLAILGVMAVTLGGVASLIGKIAPKMSGGTFMLFSIAIAIKLLVSTLVDLDKISFDNLGRGLLILLGAVVTISLIAKACSNMSFKAGLGIIGAIIGLKMLIGVFEDISELDTDKISDSLGSFIIIFGGFAAIMIASKFAGKHAAKAGVGLLAISLALLLVIRAIKNLSTLDRTAINKATNAISKLLIIFAAIVGLSYFAGKNALKAGGMLILMAGALLILTGVIALLKDMDPQGLAKATTVIAIISAVFAGLIFISQFAGTANKTITALTIAIAGIAAIVMALTLINPTDLRNAVIALGGITVMLAGLIYATKLLNTEDWWKQLILLAGITAVIAALAGVVVELSKCDSENALTNATALSELLLALSGAIVVLGIAGGKATKALPAALVMTLIVGAIALIIGLLAKCNVGHTLEIAASLSLVLLAIATSCLILSKAYSVTPTALKAAGIMTAIVAAIAIIIGVLAACEVGPTLEIAASLSLVLMAISTSCFILSRSYAIMPTALQAVGVMTAVLAGIAIIVGLLASCDVGPTLEIAASLSLLLLSLSGAVAILSYAGPGVAAAIPAATAMLELLGIVAAVILAVGAIVDAVTTTDQLDSLIVTLEKLGNAIGAFFGGIVGGFIDAAILSILPNMGKRLSEFMTNVQPFLEGARGVDSSVLSGMANLAGAILAITAAEVIQGIASFLLGENDLGSFGTKLASFGNSLIVYSKSISGLTDADIEKIHLSADAATALAKLNGKIPREGGWAQTVMGEKDLTSFGSKLAAFGECLMAYSAAVSGLTEEDAEKIKMSASAGEALAKLNGKIPNEGGWAATILGENDMAVFGSKLTAFGKGLVSYSKSISGLTDKDAENIERSAAAGEALAKLNGKIPNEGGWAAEIMGENDLASFGSKLKIFGDGLVAYARCAAQITEEDVESISRSKGAVEALVDVADAVPKEGGWGADVFGEEDIGSFGEGMYQVANALKRYIDVANTITEDDVDAIENSKDAVKAMADVAGEVPSTGGLWDLIAGEQDIGAFGAGMVSFANGLKSYANAVAGIDDDTIANIDRSSIALESMAKAAGKVPNEGGVGGWLFGDNENLGKFGANMSAFATELMSYASTVKNITDEDVTAINKSAIAMSAMATAAGQVPNEGGVGGWLFGDNENLGKFGSNMLSFAGSLMSYAKKVSEITDDDVTAINNSATAMSAMATAASAVPNSGGVVGWLFGDNTNIGAFGTNMATFASGLVTYANKAMNITDEHVTAIRNSGQAIIALREVSALVPTAFDGFNSAGIPMAIANVNAIVSMAKGMSGVNFEGVSGFSNALNTLGNTGVDNFVKAFTDSAPKVSAAGGKMIEHLVSGVKNNTPKLDPVMNSLITRMNSELVKASPKFTKAGSDLILRLTEGVKKSSTPLASSFTTTLNNSITSIKGKYASFYSAGGYLVEGFAAGITANTWAAEARAIAMAEAALAAARAVLGIASPSKEFYKLGGYSGEGFINALGDYTGKAYDASYGMSESSLDGMRDAISKVSDIMTSDIETQPTIRPVVDLSDVSASASEIDGMFGINPSIGVLSNIGSISSMMNRNQNGSNDDIIDAIYDLGKTLSGRSGDVYNLGDISYDDGSNVSEAVRTLVRAARIERRR